jgi:tRNA(Ile)-lysidine synthase
MMSTLFTDAEFAASLDPLLGAGPEGPLALAVSGGRDSMALLHLTDRYAAIRNRALLVLTVDHRLRDDSGAEAAAVAAEAQNRGLPHRLLVWHRKGPLAGNLEAEARDARYRLMAAACAEAGAGALLLGHTRDDQAETVLLRLARGSGVDGLAAMAPRVTRFGLPVLRPLLDVPRVRLEARLRADGIAWLDDPMNEEERFARVRIRKAQETLAWAGLTPVRLARTARHMARARIALEEAADALRQSAVQVAPEGYCRLALAPLMAAPEEIGLRLLARLLMSVGGQSLRPRFTALERLYRLLRQGALGRGRTLGGCRILPVRDTEAVLIVREAAGLDEPLVLEPGRAQLWDGRFHVQLGPAAGRTGGALVRALGQDGIRTLRGLSSSPPMTGIPAPVRPTLPSLWIALRGKERLAAIPHLNYTVPGFLPQARGFAARFTGL